MPGRTRSAGPRWTRKRLVDTLAACYGHSPRGGVRVAAVAEDFEVSTRTVQRWMHGTNRQNAHIPERRLARLMFGDRTGRSASSPASRVRARGDRADRAAQGARDPAGVARPRMAGTARRRRDRGACPAVAAGSGQQRHRTISGRPPASRRHPRHHHRADTVSRRRPRDEVMASCGRGGSTRAGHNSRRAGPRSSLTTRRRSTCRCSRSATTSDRPVKKRFKRRTTVYEEIPRWSRLDDRMMFDIATCDSDPRGRFDLGQSHVHDGGDQDETRGVWL